MNKYDINRSYLDDLKLTEFSVNGVILAIMYIGTKDPDRPYMLERMNPHPTLAKYWIELLSMTEHLPGTQRYPALRKRLTYSDYRNVLANAEPLG